ncbi:IclR family transcriptional regulator [Amorphus sp. 3PC139-8]|uniref:IclR family transcriptional regulator n=1 Tax=Amorphus sp. 3PC139-8 TaxID=2735676 RepID=UPI00345DABAB
MRTVEKALKILDLFTVGRPEAGLSDLARQAGLDKATTLRMLSSLARQGFVEQHPETKKYRLGKAVLRFARIRETSFPVLSMIQPALDRLAEETGETAHASLASGAELITVGIAVPQRATRVHLEFSEPLPFHATASGLAYLAFSPSELVDELIGNRPLSVYTEHTKASADDVRQDLAEIRARGWAASANSYEIDVVGIAAPIFDWSGSAYGAIAVAILAARATPELQEKVTAAVLGAAIDVTRAMGAEPDPALIKARRSLT